MADSTSPKGGSGDFAKKVQKQLSRGKEKVMQRLGKSLETRDDQFERSLQIFLDQQTDGNRIYKDLRNYINAIRDMREASRRLSQSLFDVYENGWAGEEDLGAIVEGEDLLWNDLEVKMVDQAVRTMESYVSQFPDVREKIAKRGRKLVDYDSSLHHLEALQTAKKRDDIKINKAKEEMKVAKTIYDGINNELKEELPVLYESRIGCYVAVFSAVSNLRGIFYKEMNTLNLDLQNVIKELQAQHPDKVFALRGMQRYGSLKRRSLVSPRAWKSGFEFNRSYSSRLSLRHSFRSPEKPRHSTLSRGSSSSLGLSSRSSTLDRPLNESRELDAASSHSVNQSFEAQEDAVAGTSGTEEKSEKGSSQVEEEKSSKEIEDKKDEEKVPPSESSSELNNSCESVSLDLQLSAAQSGTLHVEEEEDNPATLDSQKANGLENGDVGGLNSDPSDLSSPHKEDCGEKGAASDSKTTTV
ncbi:PREDICTED: bridging integrator 2-like [Cyprinodon variegatus]|uniref:Bridging integrator 2a n=1 Tax=Cyprinodon variegatus TaxID=28743 RepID=A0A3Q2GG24_CYPVA|nr:PREDICTED: bridging integrator 2-like [Cyprinodon variegatus]XP_015236575.1 PREDICTED: bridging integrator 2-like [Cyprinodon variegatus]XP_015236576.1 PREDICTED: bridging integrator 2-like [Cyprinodon variegatus]